MKPARASIESRGRCLLQMNASERKESARRDCDGFDCLKYPEKKESESGFIGWRTIDFGDEKNFI